MDHATAGIALLATHFATSLFPLTVRLIPVIAQIGRLIVRFRRVDLTAQTCHQFETQLQVQLRELGRIIVEWTFNHLEPHDRRDMPNQMCFQGVWYRRRFKSPNRTVATLFGTITLWRMLYQPLHGVERSITPLEIRLGLEAGLATPALAEHAARASTGAVQPGHGRPGQPQTRSWRVLVGGELAYGHRRVGRDGHGGAPPRGPGGPDLEAAGPIVRIAGEPQAGAGGGS